MASLSAIPKWQVLDGNGLPLAGALLYAYEVGTTTPKDLYTDYLDSTTAAWPLVFDSEGRSEVWLGSGLYKLILKDSDGDVIWTVDGVGSGAGGAGSLVNVNTVTGVADSLEALTPNSATFACAAGYRTISDEGGGYYYWDANTTASDGGTYIKPSSLAIGTPGRWVRVWTGDINVRAYGAYGIVGNNDTAYFTKAITYAASVGKGIYCPKGTYDLGTDPGFVHTVPVRFDPKAVLKWVNLATPNIMPIIGVDDYTQHFDCGTVIPYPPEFQPGAVTYPQWFGAAGNGTTDDVDALKACLGSVGVSGGTVIIPDGTYASSTALTLTSNLVIKGQGTIKALGSSDTAILTHATTTGTIKNVTIQDIGLDGNNTDGISLVHGIHLNGQNVIIQNTKISNTGYNAIYLYGSYGDSSNIKIIDNTINNIGIASGNFGGVHARNVDGLTITGNSITNINCNDPFAIACDPLATGQSVSNVIITDNYCDDVIEIAPYPATNQAVSDVVIDRNTLEIRAAAEGISHELASGGVKITNNEISVFSTGTGIYLAANVGAGSVSPPSYDQADYYEVANNTITGDKHKGINISYLARPLSINGNTIISTSLNTSTSAITDNIDGTSVHIEGNTIHGYQTKYNLSAHHVSYLADSFDSTFSGDSSAHRDLYVGRNLIVSDDATVTNLSVSNTIYNTGWNNASKALINGLSLEAGTISDLTCATGAAAGSSGLLMYHGSIMSKNVDAPWEPGEAKGCKSSDAACVNKAWYHIFLISKADGTTTDIGVDGDILGTNLMADATDYTDYRRIGMLYYAWDRVTPFYSRGNDFYFTVADKTAYNESLISTGNLNIPRIPESVLESQLILHPDSATWTVSDYGSAVAQTLISNEDQQVSLMTALGNIKCTAGSGNLTVEVKGWKDWRGVS